MVVYIACNMWDAGHICIACITWDEPQFANRSSTEGYFPML